ncbi:hypothetical protein BD779DRAFT_1670834 [Infundibulicybe gibba]|nr:hypothetical protein BD779DRAFT_1670834 [Infundibulicybe gibba]
MSFIPRPFPPPSLAGVPAEYIIEQLHNLAPHYWDKSQTADCTIIIPVPHPHGRSLHSVPSHFPLESLPSVSSTHDKAGLNRRATEPITNAIPRIKFKLHMDYLSAHSSYLRGLFSGASPIDLLHSPCTKHPRVNSMSLPTAFLVYFPLLPSILFSTFQYRIHHHSTSSCTGCTLAHLPHRRLPSSGNHPMGGIARNVEYLGLPNDIKVFLGDDDDDDDDETLCSDADDDDSSTASDSEPETDFDDEKEPIRGRTRAPRPLYPMQECRTFNT